MCGPVWPSWKILSCGRSPSYTRDVKGTLAQGVGAERICELTGRQTITERWVAWEEGRSFTYEGFGIPLMKRAVNRWSVLPQGEKTLLTSEAELEVKGGILVGHLPRTVPFTLALREALDAAHSRRFHLTHRSTTASEWHAARQVTH